MSLNVIGLISGGKDSLFVLAHCVENGHKLVALANLYPRTSESTQNGLNNGNEDDAGDINSFMYQTVGHTIIPLYSEALGLPLFRQQITGSAVQNGRYYDTSHADTSLDETEDLVPLLKQVLKRYPESNALCSGAILSTYQRTRVESVAIRLGLTPLSYLWQYPALPPPVGRAESLTGLLDDMEAAGCDARIIKIASGGVKDSLLWSNVADARTKAQIVAGMTPFYPEQEFWLRGAILGEGGEYETLALDGPTSIWKKTIETDGGSSVAGEGGTSYVVLSAAKAVPRDMTSTNQMNIVRIPALLDDKFMTMSEEVSKTSDNDISFTKALDYPSISTSKLRYSSCLTSNDLAINNITSMATSSTSDIDTPATQLSAIVEQLPTILSGLHPTLTTSKIVSSTLLLNSISDFAAVNPIYARIWPSGLPNPPARVTIAAPLPPNVLVSLSLILSLQPVQMRRGLHVQSRSYWAPANIGPYSQAIAVPMLPLGGDPDVNIHDAHILETVHVAGQIPLLPASMELVQAPFVEQAVLALQHLWRIGQERQVDLWPWGVAYLDSGHTDISDRASQAMEIWKLAHEMSTHGAATGDTKATEIDEEIDNEIDVWDLQQNRSHSLGLSFGRQWQATAATVGEHLHILPNQKVFESGGGFQTSQIPPCIVAEVTSLPRKASIEWWSMGLANLVSLKEQEKLSRSRRFLHRRLSWGDVTSLVIEIGDDLERERMPAGVSLTQESQDTKRVLFVTISVDASTDLTDEKLPRNSSELLALLDLDSEPQVQSKVELVHATAFCNLSQLSESSIDVCDLPLLTKTTIVPCYRVFVGSEGMARDTTNVSDPKSNEARGNNNVESLRAVLFAATMRIDVNCS